MMPVTHPVYHKTILHYRLLCGYENDREQYVHDVYTNALQCEETRDQHVYIQVEQADNEQRVDRFPDDERMILHLDAVDEERQQEKTDPCNNVHTYDHKPVPEYVPETSHRANRW